MANQFPDSLTIAGRGFALVGVQRGGETAVYRGDGEYLRIGSPAKIAPAIALHRRMERCSFPIAKLVEDGFEGAWQYFIETSLGVERLGIRFARETEEKGSMSEEAFRNLVDISMEFGKAQMQVLLPADWDGFAKGIHLDILKDELPQHAEQIDARFAAAKERLSALPFVLTHGDFNANNLYSGGVIDFEDSFHAPMGYDLMTVLVHMDYFPHGDEYEFRAKYAFTDEQKAAYRAIVDALAASYNLPPLSQFEEDFAFCRGSWSLVRMQEWPKIQKFRYDLFTARFLA